MAADAYKFYENHLLVLSQRSTVSQPVLQLLGKALQTVRGGGFTRAASRSARRRRVAIAGVSTRAFMVETGDGRRMTREKGGFVLAQVQESSRFYFSPQNIWINIAWIFRTILVRSVFSYLCFHHRYIIV